MNRTPFVAFLVAGLGTVSAVAAAQDSSNLNLGGSVGIYLPTSSRIRDAFGQSILNVGVSPVSARPSSGSLTPSFQTLSANKNGNKLFVGTFTYGYEYHGDEDGTVLPFARAFGGASYFDYAITESGTRNSLKRLGYTYGAEVGVVIGGRLQVAARYNVYSKENAFDFNGFVLSATYSFVKL